MVGQHEPHRSILQMGGDEVKRRIVGLLPCWYEHVFAPNEQEWRAAAEATRRSGGWRRGTRRSSSSS